MSVISNKNKLNQLICGVLFLSGIKPKFKGYIYLKEAIVIAYTNPESFNMLTKIIYPQIAEKYEVSPNKVERGIRTAIEKAWKQCGGNGFYERMGVSWVKDNWRPTNSEYIYLVVEYLNNYGDYKV